MEAAGQQVTKAGTGREARQLRRNLRGVRGSAAVGGHCSPAVRGGLPAVAGSDGGGGADGLVCRHCGGRALLFEEAGFEGEGTPR